MPGAAAAAYAGPAISLSFVLSGIACAFAGLFPIDFIGEMVSIGALLAFAMVSAGVLRYTRPDYPRPFRTPWVPFVPVMGCLLALLQMGSLPGGTWVRLVVWMAIGLLIYAGYGHSHSRLHCK